VDYEVVQKDASAANAMKFAINTGREALATQMLASTKAEVHVVPCKD